MKNTYLLNKPRHQTANASLPGNPLFWETMVSQSLYFAARTSHALYPDFPKGGPFGSQLWLVNERSNQYVMCGTEKNWQHSNGVVKKKDASAHAEAMNLSPYVRRQVFNFLKNHKNEGWKIVHVSSGESCQSCRTKQVFFSTELSDHALIPFGDYYVVFPDSFERTLRNSDFSDLFYDRTYRAINALGLLNEENGLYRLGNALSEDRVTGNLVRGKPQGIIWTPIYRGEDRDITKLNRPFAKVVAKSGETLSEAFDTRRKGMNMPEKMAIPAALRAAAQKLHSMQVDRAWDLRGAKVVTNINPRDMAFAYGDAMWFNLSGIHVVSSKFNDAVRQGAKELPFSDKNAFELAVMEYDDPSSPIRVKFMPWQPENTIKTLIDLDNASPAQVIWRAQNIANAELSRQGQRVEKLADQVNVYDITGKSIVLGQIVMTDRGNTDVHYDGARAVQDLTLRP